MKFYLSILFPLFLLAMTVSAQAQLLGRIPSREETILNDSYRCLNEIMAIPASGIPEGLFAKAEGVAIFPGLIKGSFFIGGQHGNGVLIVKNEEGGWQAPRFLQMSGGSFGFQAGLQSADIILVFCTQRSVQAALDGDFTIGGDASVAAGPVGRQALASTNYQFNSEIYSYSRSRGLFLGVAVDGCVLHIDEDVNLNYYASGIPEPARRVTLLTAEYARKAQQPTPEDGNPAQVPAQSQTPAVSPAPTTLGTANQPSPQMTDQEAARVLLIPAHEDLMKILEPEWQKWLALPPEARIAGNNTQTPALQTLYERLEKVNSDSKYAELVARPEFDRVYHLLKLYLGKE